MEIGIKNSQRVQSKRAEYSNGIDYVLELAREKLMNNYTKNQEKLQWARIIIQAASSGNDILRDTEIEELSLRITEIEEALKKNENNGNKK